MTRDVWITGAQRRECVRDLAPPRGATNLIVRSPCGPLGITRLYRLTDSGLAAFETNPALRPADHRRVKQIRRQRAAGIAPRLDDPAPMPVAPDTFDWSEPLLRVSDEEPEEDEQEWPEVEDEQDDEQLTGAEI